jgi:hypothetical protein
MSNRSDSSDSDSENGTEVISFIQLPINDTIYVNPTGDGINFYEIKGPVSIKIKCDDDTVQSTKLPLDDETHVKIDKPIYVRYDVQVNENSETESNSETSSGSEDESRHSYKPEFVRIYCDVYVSVPCSDHIAVQTNDSRKRKREPESNCPCKK